VRAESLPEDWDTVPPPELRAPELRHLPLPDDSEGSWCLSEQMELPEVV
jgi:hypothetical protein